MALLFTDTEKLVVGANLEGMCEDQEFSFVMSEMLFWNPVGDAVQLGISAPELRRKVWTRDLNPEVACISMA